MKNSHKVWHKFYKWLQKTFGNDLYSEWRVMVFKNPKTNRNKKIKYRNYDEVELSRRLIGYEVMERIEKYIKRNAPEIKICWCDDTIFASSMILLIPHSNHGITMMFIPQLGIVQNQLFLYDNHCQMLTNELEKMKEIAYKKETL